MLQTASQAFDNHLLLWVGICPALPYHCNKFVSFSHPRSTMPFVYLLTRNMCTPSDVMMTLPTKMASDHVKTLSDKSY